jgi:hypothetical protein
MPSHTPEERSPGQGRSKRLAKHASAAAARRAKADAREAAKLMTSRDKRVSVLTHKKIWAERVAALEEMRPGGRGNEIPLETKQNVLLMFFRLWTEDGKAVPHAGLDKDIKAITGRCKRMGQMWKLDWRVIYKLVTYYLLTGTVKMRLAPPVEVVPDPVLRDIRAALVAFKEGKTHVPVLLGGLVNKIASKHKIQMSPQHVAAIAADMGYM